VQEQGLADTWEEEWVVVVEQAQAQELGSVPELVLG